MVFWRRILKRPANATLAGAVAFFTALYFYLPVMTLYFFHRGLNLFQVSAISSIIVAAQFAAEIPTGILADRWGRRTAWIISIFLQFVGEAWFLFARSYWEFILIAVIGGFGFAFASGAVDALIYDTLPEQDRDLNMKQAMGKMAAAGRIGNLVAFLISGLIFTELTPVRFSLGIALTAVSVGVGFILTFLVCEPSQQPVIAERISSLGIFKSGLKVLKQNPNLRRIALLMILTDPFGFFLISYYQPYLARAGVPGALLGPLLAVGSLLAALGEHYAYKIELRLGTRFGMLLGTTLPGILYITMSPVRQSGMAVFLFILLYSSMFASRPLLRSYINRHIASQFRATALSMIQLLSSIYLALMGLLLGAVGNRSISGLFLLMGAIVLISALVFRIDERHM